MVVQIFFVSNFCIWLYDNRKEKKKKRKVRNKSALKSFKCPGFIYRNLYFFSNCHHSHVLKALQLLHRSFLNQPPSPFLSLWQHFPVSVEKVLVKLDAGKRSQENTSKKEHWGTWTWGLSGKEGCEQEHTQLSGSERNTMISRSS